MTNPGKEHRVGLLGLFLAKALAVTALNQDQPQTGKTVNSLDALSWKKPDGVMLETTTVQSIATNED